MNKQEIEREEEKEEEQQQQQQQPQQQHPWTHCIYIKEESRKRSIVEFK